MLRTALKKIFNDPVRVRVITLCITLFFITLADAVISFWVPNLLENKLQNLVFMGLIVSFQSVVGLASDIIFSQILKLATVKKLLLMAIVTSIITTLILFAGIYRPFVIVFLLAMAFWGVYYELLAFASHQFVADAVPLRDRPSAWGIYSVIRSIAYLLGPLLASWLLVSGVGRPGILSMGFALVALLVLFLSLKAHDRPLTLALNEINFQAEVSHWAVLYKYVWPMVTMSLLLGFIDASFWTVGAVWSAEIAKSNYLGVLILPVYSLPTLFMGLIVCRIKINIERKKMAEMFFVLTGLFLLGMGLINSIYWILPMVFLSSAMYALCYPYLEGTYSDIIARMGRERKHMIGLTNSVINLSYIFCPVIIGAIAMQLGEHISFSILGGVIVLVGSILLLVTPHNIRLPEHEIATWDK